jgi:signal transduction histidine kinase
VTDRPEDHLQRSGLVFFATLTASVTHELNNALSIVDQSGGLLGDLAAGVGSGIGIDPRRLETLHERIDRQVRKGVMLLNRFNRFAHSLDDPDRAFDAGAETENLVALARRLAELKLVRLEYPTNAEEIRVCGSAFTLQHGVFTCLQNVLGVSEEGDRIEVGVRRAGSEAVVSIVATATCTPRDDDPSIRLLSCLMESLGGTHGVRPTESGGTSFELRLPLASSRAAAHRM